jgi:hypothetical protein
MSHTGGGFQKKGQLATNLSTLRRDKGSISMSRKTRLRFPQFFAQGNFGWEAHLAS